MTKRNSSGSERAQSEKSQGIIETPTARRERLAKKKAEEKEWADKSGPVTTRKKTMYEVGGASDGKGGPHPLAGVPQAALDAATKEFRACADTYGFADFLDSDDEFESIAHSILLAAVKANRDLHPKLAANMTAQEEYDSSPELREMLNEAAAAPTVERSYPRHR